MAETARCPVCDRNVLIAVRSDKRRRFTAHTRPAVRGSVKCLGSGRIVHKPKTQGSDNGD